MPTLSLTKTAANGLAHDASHVNTPLTEVETWANTTKLDYLNIQDNGLRVSGLRTHANVEGVRIKVRNATGGTIAANSLVYFSGTHSDGTNNYPKITKAISTTSVGSTYFAQAVTSASIADGADGTAAIFLELSSQNTSSGTVGDLVYLDTTAGGWTRTRPTGGQYIQVVGTITVVHASTGRIVLSLGAVPEHLTGGSSGLGATFQTLTVQGASGAAADIYHFGDAGEDAADKWKVSVADGGVMTWENYTSGSYVAKMTMTSAGVVSTAGAITSSGAVTGSTLVGTVSTAAQNSITSASSLATVGTVTSGTWSGVIDGSATITMGSDATGDMYYRAASTGYLTRLAAGADGTVLTGTGAGSIPAWESVSAGVSLSGTTDGTIATVTGANALEGEANLTFDGTTMNVVGNAGVGIARTDGTLHVHTATAGTVDANANEDDLVVENSTHGGITILTPDANDSSLVFGSHSDAVGAVVRWNHDADLFRVLTANAGASMTLETGSGVERMRIHSTGLIQTGGGGTAPVTMNDSVNEFNDAGLTIMQDGHDDEILSLKSSDIAHGFNSITQTDTFFKVTKSGADTGGVTLSAVATDSALSHPFQINSYGGTASTAKSASGTGLVMMSVTEHNGANAYASVAANGNIFAIRAFISDNYYTKFIIDEDGDVHYDGATNANQSWDDHDDIGLLGTVRNLTTGNKAQNVFGEFVEKNAQILHDTGVITMNDDGRHFVSTKGLNALIIDTIRQEGQKWREVIGDYKDKITALESRLMRLEN